MNIDDHLDYKNIFWILNTYKENTAYAIIG